MTKQETKPKKLRHYRLKVEPHPIDEAIRLLRKAQAAEQAGFDLGINCPPEDHQDKEIGPFEPQWLRALFDVETNRTLRKRLNQTQREETERKWYVPVSCLNALGDWKTCLRERSQKRFPEDHEKIELFLSLQ